MLTFQLPKIQDAQTMFAARPRATATPHGWILSYVSISTSQIGEIHQDQKQSSFQQLQGTHLFRFDGEYKKIHRYSYFLHNLKRFICWHPERGADDGSNEYYQNDGSISNLDNAWEIPPDTTSQKVLTINSLQPSREMIPTTSHLHVAHKHFLETTGLKEQNQILVYDNHAKHKVVEIGDEPIFMAYISHDGQTIFLLTSKSFHILDNPLIE